MSAEPKVISDLSPIGNIAAVPNIMSVHPAVKAKRLYQEEHGREYEPKDYHGAQPP